MPDHVNEIVTYIGRQVRRRRLKNGWTMRELAAHAGVTAATICDVERGKKRISADRLHRIAVVFQTTLGRLVP